jgi:hypothetical protein
LGYHRPVLLGRHDVTRLACDGIRALSRSGELSRHTPGNLRRHEYRSPCTYFIDDNGNIARVRKTS